MTHPLRAEKAAKPVALNHDGWFSSTRKIVLEHTVFQGLLGGVRRPEINLTSTMPDCFRAEPHMMTKADEADVEEAKGSITEAIGMITAHPLTEDKGAAMKKAAQQRNALNIASDASKKIGKS